MMVAPPNPMAKLLVTCEDIGRHYIYIHTCTHAFYNKDYLFLISKWKRRVFVHLQSRKERSAAGSGIGDLNGQSHSDLDGDIHTNHVRSDARGHSHDRGEPLLPSHGGNSSSSSKSKTSKNVTFTTPTSTSSQIHHHHLSNYSSDEQRGLTLDDLKTSTPTTITPTHTHHPYLSGVDKTTKVASSRYKIPTPFKMPATFSDDNDKKEEYDGHSNFIPPFSSSSSLSPIS